ncbi:MAG: HIT family protein [Kangiellaceae bacterium]|jgi:diadenosine tetraphosphate (Ap4A) HIT family hydrolase|nr:HIT family protein [Kangiellaceae bacterium]
MTKVADCIFCNLPADRIIKQTEHFIVIRDGYAVTEGHSLVIPKRHAETWFDLTEQEQAEANQVLVDLKAELELGDSSISGFNIGMNCGEAAGQTVMHCHIHLIPRRVGDCEDPRGGVRGVIADRQKY